MIEIVTGNIDPQRIIDKMRTPVSGAVVTFGGTVRDFSRGRKVTHLFYESYSKMAVKQMEKIRSEALERWPIEEMAIVHRVGRMEIGETSVFIAVTSAHRAEAFEACRFAIDALKTRVPIWKKEFYEGGEVWIEEYAAG